MSIEPSLRGANLTSDGLPSNISSSFAPYASASKQRCSPDAASPFEYTTLVLIEVGTHDSTAIALYCEEDSHKYSFDITADVERWDW